MIALEVAWGQFFTDVGKVVLGALIAQGLRDYARWFRRRWRIRHERS